MSILELKENLKDAMRAKNEVQLSVIRGILAACTNELVAKGKKPQDVLDDVDVQTVIMRLAKQRKDSIDQFEKGGRKDLADKERQELIILESYLPTMMLKDEIRVIAEKKKTELGITDKAKLGQFVGVLMKELKGKADGGDVKAVAESLF